MHKLTQAHRAPGTGLKLCALPGRAWKLTQCLPKGPRKFQYRAPTRFGEKEKERRKLAAASAGWERKRWPWLGTRPPGGSEGSNYWRIKESDYPFLVGGKPLKTHVMIPF